MKNKDLNRDEILISIKPEYAYKIFDRTKTWEYRRRIWKGPVEKVFVYSTLPIGRVIGFFYVGGISKKPPSKLWEGTHKHSGISKEEFFKYFHGAEYGYAIHINYARLYRSFKTLQLFAPGVKAPQSFIYI